jgi:hypothetical protein
VSARFTTRFNAVEETGSDDPFIAETEVVGLYPADRAASASAWTTTLDPHGNRDDD